MKVKYKEQEIDIPENANIEVIDGDLVVTPKELEFKDGDILFTKDDELIGGIICLIYRHDNQEGTGYYCSFSSECGLEINTQHWDHRIKFNIASYKEKQMLFEELEKQGKRWNPETNQIEDILKVGDICIFWDKNKSKAIISTLFGYHPENLFPNKMYKSNNFGWYLNAIKCTSIEQYINFIK